MRGAKWLIVAAVGLILVFAPYFLDRYQLYVLYLILFNIGFAQSWNLLGGYTGLVSLGHSAFLGLGAYTTAMLVAHAGFHFLVAATIGGLVAMGFGALIAFPTFRFRGIYFAVGTLVLADGKWAFSSGVRVWTDSPSQAFLTWP